jgi:23S rRNA pseudouridine1911/1915/1917 synthase
MRAFADGRVQKSYVAVVEGVVDAAVVVEAPLALQGDRGLVRIRVIVDDAGQAARTRVEPVAVKDGRSLVRCRPETGRQHQLRVHLAHIGHPIVGDKLYQMGDAWFDAWTRRALSDDERSRLPCPRQCLHASRVALDDDVFEAPLPADLRAVFERVSSAP